MTSPAAPSQILSLAKPPSNSNEWISSAHKCWPLSSARPSHSAKAGATLNHPAGNRNRTPDMPSNAGAA